MLTIIYSVNLEKPPQHDQNSISSYSRGPKSKKLKKEKLYNLEYVQGRSLPIEKHTILSSKH
jgi:hypothetical protein